MARSAGMADAAVVIDGDLARIESLVRDFPDEHYVLAPYLNGHFIAVRGVMEADPDRAEALLRSVRWFLETFETDDPEVRRILDATRTAALPPHEATLRGIRSRRAAIGEPALLIDGDWVRGGPLSADDYRGKVVLIDFWGVWCRPCLDALPEVRDWQETYADRGLVIVGVTQYSGYVWDESLGRAAHVEGLTRDDERDRLARFAEDHDMDYAILAVPRDVEGGIFRAYAVDAVPRVVMIDRRGCVRPIEQGNSEETTTTIEAALMESE